ncbi:hypothetical protein FJT64_002306 [Amphibalanus amphitrite]|uniref:Uncharacterized protein n=1 Tax=Amphibalanus amphitrite TaxID=1232801 RepID=A0A6A4WQ12_AMPAM|nr:hypothetical protein FJT64_002306 [Amphibalanus amphitrite]
MEDDSDSDEYEFANSELTVTAAPAGGGTTGAADGPVAAVDVAALESQQLTDASHLRLEPNLVLVAADTALDAPTAARWLQHTLTPKLLSGEMPSAELVSALVGLSGRHPEQIIEHCLLPLTAGELLTCDDLATRLVTEGLQETHRMQLVRRLCGRPLSPAAVSLLLSLLPVCPPSADLAATLTDRLESSAAEEQHRSSAAFARLLLLTVQRTGHLLDAGERARLAAAAERGRTALRRAVQAALRKLE